jgi:8-oxo-dGTP diphosphatase
MKLVTAAIIRDGEKYFIARRGLAEKLAGFWEFPGGKVEGNESLQDCLKREIREELGIDVSVGAELISSDYVYEHGSIRLVALTTIIVNGRPTLTVHDKYDWLRPAEILKLKLAPADIPIAEFLLNKTP